jgi:hypothetical protein
MAVTLLAAWLVVAPQERRARFWWFIASNILWVVWAWHVHAWALIALQVGCCNERAGAPSKRI